MAAYQAVRALYKRYFGYTRPFLLNFGKAKVHNILKLITKK